MSTLKDLNAALFAQLDRLATADAKNLDQEITRAKSIQLISAEIVSAHNTQLDAVKLIAQYKGLNSNQQAPMIATGDMEIEL